LPICPESSQRAAESPRTSSGSPTRSSRRRYGRLSGAIVVSALLWTYPFLPRHLTIIDLLTIGVPSFFLALAPNLRRYVPGFVDRVLRFSVPAGVVVAASVFAGYAVARLQGLSGTSERRCALLVAVTLSLGVLVLAACRSRGGAAFSWVWSPSASCCSFRSLRSASSSRSSRRQSVSCLDARDPAGPAWALSTRHGEQTVVSGHDRI
jgi:hypothetical protein